MSEKGQKMDKTQRDTIPGALTSSRNFALSRLARMAVRQRRFALIVTIGGMAATAPFLIMSKSYDTETTTALTKPHTLSSETLGQVSVASRQSCKQPSCEATGVQARALSYTAADAGATSSSAKWPAVLWAGLLWGLAGLGLGMVRELFDKRIRTSEDVASSLGVPCVATIPVIEPALCEPGRARQKGFLGPVLWRCDDELDETLSRALFALRRWAFRGSPGSSTVVLVVAAHQSEGCSTVAAQLALYAAGTATSTVLVDADLRHCGLTDALDIVHQHTFADVIASGADVKAAIVRSPEFGFDFCPAPDRAG